MATALLALVGAWHLLFWVLAPMASYAMLPLDTLEALGWGQEWQLGYYKHPPLGAWLAEAWLRLFGGWHGSLYLLAQLCVVATLGYAWRTALLVLDPARAALAAALLAGSYFHVLLSPNFNMNLLQLPLWAGFGHHLLRALRGDSWHWLAVAAFAALCVLAKYSGLLLLASGAMALLADPRGRAALRSGRAWLGLLLALLLVAPHLAWLREHWQLPLGYLRGFDAASAGWQWHLVEPLRFAAGALGSLLLCAVLLLPLLDLRRGGKEAVGTVVPSCGLDGRPGDGTPENSDGAVQRRLDARVLALLVLGPLLLSMAYGVASGSRLKTTWAAPFFTFAGVLALLWLPTRVDLARLRRFAVLLVAVLLLSGGGHLAYKLGSERSKTAFDGPVLAAAVADAWAQRFDAPLRIVAADHVLAAIVSGYAPGRPSMLVAGDFTRSPWLSPEALARDGAVVVCEAGAAPCLPDLPEGIAAQDLVVDGRRFVLRVVPPSATQGR